MLIKTISISFAYFFSLKDDQDSKSKIFPYAKDAIVIITKNTYYNIIFTIFHEPSAFPKPSAAHRLVG